MRRFEKSKQHCQLYGLANSFAEVVQTYLINKSLKRV